MFFKTQIDKKILENNLPNYGPTKKSMHDNYVKVGQISLYNEKKAMLKSVKYPFIMKKN